MTEEERRALGATRRLAFQNLALGVPPEKVAEDLRFSLAELERARAFVARKITEFLFLRHQPPVPCADLRDCRWHRRALLAVLARIGDLDLSTDLIIRITTQALDHPEMIEGAQHRMSEAR